MGRDGRQPGCGGPPTDDTRYHPQQEGEEGERDDDRGERRRALHDLPGPRGVPRRVLQGEKLIIISVAIFLMIKF